MKKDKESYEMKARRMGSAAHHAKMTLGKLEATLVYVTEMKGVHKDTILEIVNDLRMELERAQWNETTTTQDAEAIHKAIMGIR